MVDNIIRDIEAIRGILEDVEEKQGAILLETDEDVKIRLAYESSKQINEVLAIMQYCILRDLVNSGENFEHKE